MNRRVRFECTNTALPGEGAWFLPGQPRAGRHTCGGDRGCQDWRPGAGRVVDSSHPPPYPRATCRGFGMVGEPAPWGAGTSRRM